MDEDKRRWLATLEAACERVLADESGDLNDPLLLAVRADVARLLRSVTSELADGGAPRPPARRERG
jgi:hypothetical protein